MKTAQLTGAQRIQLASILMAQEGTRRRLHVVDRVYGKIRLDDAEQAEVREETHGNQSVVFFPTAAGWGDKPVELEREEAALLAEVCDTWPHFKRHDLAWVDVLIESLRA